MTIFSNPGFFIEDGMLEKEQKSEHMKRHSENHNEGSLTYQYRLGGWEPLLDNCVLQVIKYLERKAEVIY